MCTLNRVFTNFDEHYLNYVSKIFSNGRTLGYELAGINENKGNLYDILDIGCGIGFDTVEIAKVLSNKARIVGIDKDSNMIKRAKERAEVHNLKNLQYYCTDASDMTFQKEFDLVYASRLFQHLNFPELIFRKMMTATKPNGRLTIVDTDWSTFNCRFLNSLDNQLISNMYTEQLIYKVDLSKFQQLFNKYGLTDIKTETINIQLSYDDYIKVSKIKEIINNLYDMKAVIRVKEVLRLKMDEDIFGDINIIIISGNLPN